MQIQKSSSIFVSGIWRLRVSLWQIPSNVERILRMVGTETENKDGAGKKKLPYKLRERKIIDAAYRGQLRKEVANDLYDKILQVLFVQKKYKELGFTARKLAKELNTDPRYLSAVINSRFGKNFSCLVNEFRIKDALRMLVDQRYAEYTIEEISVMVGFANRQSFYAAFYRVVGAPPTSYRERKKASDEEPLIIRNLGK